MSTQYTPGPWHAARLYDVARNGSPILAADRQVGVFFAHGQNGEANARLIASAPDLLAALYASEIALRSCLHQNVQVDAAFEQVRAAISKAEGNA